MVKIKYGPNLDPTSWYHFYLSSCSFDLTLEEQVISKVPLIKSADYLVPKSQYEWSLELEMERDALKRSIENRSFAY